MDYKDYSKQKYDYDKNVMQYLCKRLLQPIEDSDAYKEDLVDSAGQVISNADASNQWAMTPLDMLVFHIRSKIGRKALQSMLSNYIDLVDVDAMMLINTPNMDINKYKKYAESIITKVESKEYLPNYLYPDSDQTWEDSENELGFTDRLSRALTILTYLLYSLRNDKVCGTVDFECNVIPSVECTFNVQPCKDYEWIVDHCKKCGLTDASAITDEGMRLLHHASKDIVDAGLTNDKRTRIEDQSYNWRQLAGI